MAVAQVRIAVLESARQRDEREELFEGMGLLRAGHELSDALRVGEVACFIYDA